MKMKKLNNSGFGAVELIIILVIIALLAGGGWLFYSRRHKTTTTTTKTSVTASTSTTKTEVDPTADWVSYSSKEGEYSLKYPKTWSTATNADKCADGLLLLGADAASTGKCASDFGGQMQFVSTASTKDTYSLGSSYIDTTSEVVTVNGVTGRKLTGTYKSDGSEMVGGLKDGAKVTVYVFVTNGRMYTMSYYSASASADYPDALSDFNTLVTKTFAFHS